MAKNYSQAELDEMKFGDLVKTAGSLYKAGMTREDVIAAILNDGAPEPEEAPQADAEQASEEEKKEATEKPKKEKKEKKEKDDKKEKKERKPRAKKTGDQYIEESGVDKKEITKILKDGKMSHSDKIRALFDVGLTVPRAISVLTGRHYSFVYEVLCKYRASTIFDALAENFKKWDGKKPASLSDAMKTKMHKEQLSLHQKTYTEFGLGEGHESPMFTEADYKRVGKNAAEKVIEKTLKLEEDEKIANKDMQALVSVFYGK